MRRPTRQQVLLRQLEGSLSSSATPMFIQTLQVAEARNLKLKRPCRTQLVAAFSSGQASALFLFLVEHVDLRTQSFTSNGRR